MITPPTAQAPAGPPRARRTNRLAVIALITGLLGLFMIAVGCALAALPRTGRHGDRGRGLAVAGLAAGLAWAVALAAVVAVAVTSADGGGAVPAGVQPYPKVGQCFDFPNGRLMTDTRIVPCDRPHEAELILTFDVPDTLWPGSDILVATGRPGCWKRLLERFRTRSPVEGGEVVALLPQRAGWPRDRAVRCAATAPQAVQMTGRVNALGKRLRMWDELNPSDCFDLPPDERLPSVRYQDCARPHDAQVLGGLTMSAYSGTEEKVLRTRAAGRCASRWAGRLARHPARGRFTLRAAVLPLVSLEDGSPPVPGAEGDRLVVCHIRATGPGRLTTSVAPPLFRA
ncbi:septum formation family protein [Actinomadura roseirufa]|uniref:septum formation family protein n=1 Tax=Actinomadura roseirufa TaxID=2094049 RepID=UPI0010413CF2|nr:septum formation family protein [Actinomadura roseirufa]